MELMRIYEYRNSVMKLISNIPNKLEVQDKGKNESEKNKRQVNDGKGDAMKTLEIYLGTTLIKIPSQVDPFYIKLLINNRLVKNCMIDSRAINIMPMMIMKELGLWVDSTYGKCYAMYNISIPIIGIMSDVEINLATYPEATYRTNIIVVDIPPYYGILLSKIWIIVIGGNVQLDLSYATITMNGKEVNCTRNQDLSKW